ncbi:hypothetical protein [Catenuloplanes atrovinosus]|uniref:Lipoprotein n=1 Tax=Catenuloplanes atrovinosus TaxID=137266 RepID=A0AAE3YJ92_9ACTN|nr:hypothetical protein [Catenuloplanes atrovinosus]MDR7273467.1 hypothetical protein [Catenuloplanes atrovinosus]
MKSVKITIAILSAATVLGVAAGCGGSGDAGGTGTPAAGGTTAAAPATTPADPKEAFLGAFAALNERHFAYTLTLDETKASGVMHAPSTSSRSVSEGELEGTKFSTETVYAGGKAFVKLDFGAANANIGIDPATWYELDLNVAKQLNYTFEQQSPIQPSFSTSIASVERDGDDAFTGAFDFAAATKGNPSAQTKSLVQMLGDAAKSATFDAHLDDQGRIAELVFTIAKTDKTPEIKQTLTFTEYGTAAAPEVPTNAQPAPASLNNLYK